MKAEEKRRLAKERDSKIGPYEDIKLTIDQAITKMDQAKLQVETYLSSQQKQDMKEETVRCGRVTVSQTGQNQPEIISISLCQAKETGEPIVFTIRVNPNHVEVAANVDLYGGMVQERIRIAPKVLCQ